MKQYFRLEDDVTIPNRWHLGAAALQDGAEPRLRAGLRFESSSIPSIPVTHVGRVLEFTLTSFAVPIVTRKLAQAVESVATTDIQLIECSIAGQEGMVVLNALRAILCVDEERSEFEKWTTRDHRPDLAGQYRQITNLVLNRTMIPPDAHVFRIAGSLVELVVSEVVKDAMERVGCVGAKFVSVQASAS